MRKRERIGLDRASTRADDAVAERLRVHLVLWFVDSPGFISPKNEPDLHIHLRYRNAATNNQRFSLWQTEAIFEYGM